MATEGYVDSSTAALLIDINENQALIEALNDISAADVWSYANRSLNGGVGEVDLSATATAAIWARATSTLSQSGSIGKLLADNLDAQVSSRGTSNLTAADVWNAATRSLTDYSTSTLATAIWNSGSRTLTNYGNDITAADVWNVLSSSLTTADSIGKQLKDNVDMANSAIAADVWSESNRSLTDYSTTSIASAVWSSPARSLTTFGTLASDVWSNASRSLTDYSTSTIAAGVWSSPARSLTTFGTLVSDLTSSVWSNPTRTLSAFGNLAADVWNGAYAPNRALTDYSTSTIASAVWNSGARTLTDYGNDYSTSTIASAVWSNATRTLTYYGNDISAADVWNYIGTITHTGQSGAWSVTLMDTQTILASQSYRAKVYTKNSNVAEDSYAAPRAYIYDSNRNLVASNVELTNIGAGIYEYVYSVPTGAVQGNWETVIRTEISSGTFVEISDFWEVRGAPAQVIINSIADDTIPSVVANVTITNEGVSGYEYQYAWCVVNNANDVCDGVGDIYYATAAKYINPGEDWNTNLTATVPAVGDYFFKMIVYFGSESSGSSRSFTARAGTVPTCPSGQSWNGSVCVSSGGGGGGGGGGAGLPPITPPVAPSSSCSGADFNNDKKVNSIDFSILLAFWKTAHPFRNPCVDINSDRQVNSVDFSILMYQWGNKK